MDISWPEGKRIALSLSFDDARPSQMDVGLPLLSACGARVTFYAIPRNVALRPEAWLCAVAAGHEIGNHTVSHPCSRNFSFSRQNGLEAYTLARMEHELIECNRLLEESCGIRPTTFAYPCGQTFVGCGSSTQSYVPLVADHFCAGRGFPSEYHNVPAVCDMAQLCGRSFDQTPFSTILEWLESSREEGGWLILAGHDIGLEACFQTVQADVLQALCEYALDARNGVWLDTVATVARYVRNWRKESGMID